MRTDTLIPVTEAVFDDSAEGVNAVIVGVVEAVKQAAGNPAQVYLAPFNYAYQSSKVALIATTLASDAGGVELTLRTTAVTTRTLLQAVREYLVALGYIPRMAEADRAEWELPAGFRVDGLRPLALAGEVAPVATEMRLLSTIASWLSCFRGSGFSQRHGYQQTHRYSLDDIRGKVDFAAHFLATGVHLSRQEVAEDRNLAVLVGTTYSDVRPPCTARVILSARFEDREVLGDVVDGERLAHNLKLLQPEWQVDGTLRCLTLLV